jgi:bacteriorhodopsin
MAWELAVVFGSFAVPFLLTNMASKFKGENSTWIKLLFFFFGLIFLGAAIRVLYLIAELNNANIAIIVNGVFFVYLPVAFLVIFLIFVYFMLDIVQQKKQKRDGEEE